MSRSVKVDKQGGTYSSLGYRSANSSTLDGISYTGGGGDEHLLYDRLKLIHQSRDFYRNNAIYKGIIDRAVSYIMGTGFTLEVNTRNKTFNQQFQRLWQSWWKKPEIRNLLSGAKTGQMVCREAVLCGSTGAVKTDRALVQLIEAEQITKKAYGYGNDGIDKDLYGRPVMFHVTGYNRNGRLDGRTTRQISPEYFIFITDPERPSSTHGTPAMQSSFPMLHRINDVFDSEAISWQLLSRLTASITRENGPELGFQQSRPNTDAADTEGDLATRMTDIGYALLFHGKPGEEIKGIDRNVPGKDFTASTRMFLRLLGLPLGMPLELVLLDWTQSNYSQTRAVLWQAYHQTFCGWQDLIADQFLDVILEWKYKHFVQSGELADRPDGLDHSWIKPTFPWIDQLKEAEAYGQRMDRGFATHSLVCNSLNLDRDQVNNARRMEVMDAIAIAADITKETGEKVPWQMFAGLEVPESKAVQPENKQPKKPNQADEINE